MRAPNSSSPLSVAWNDCRSPSELDVITDELDAKFQRFHLMGQLLSNKR